MTAIFTIIYQKTKKLLHKPDESIYASLPARNDGGDLREFFGYKIKSNEKIIKIEDHNRAILTY